MISIAARSISLAQPVRVKSSCLEAPIAHDQQFTSLSIHPRDVIKKWVLCHHLGWVVQYLGHATCKASLPGQTRLEQARLGQTLLEQAQQRLADLKKAEGYLAREIAHSPKCTQIPIEPQAFTTREVIEDWGLSHHLSETLFYIKASKSSYMRQGSLEQAMKHLRKEIKACETKIKLHAPKTPENSGQINQGGKRA